MVTIYGVMPYRRKWGNVCIVFNILEPSASPPIGYKCIPCWMIFDIKIDFMHKARAVAGGHVTDPPLSITYSLVVSRKTVHLAFVVAALNELNIMAANITHI
jgi:hypothetical protein